MRSFVHLVDAGSATKAARARGLAVSAISRRIKDLETRLGVQLVHRTTRTMGLTDEGRVFYDRCVKILADLAEAEAEVTQRSDGLRGILKIATPLSFGIAHLSPALSAFMHTHPDLVIHLDMNDRPVDLVAEGFDLAVRIGELKDSTLTARKIANFRHVVCAAPSFFKAHGYPSHPRDLEGLPGLCYGNLPNPPVWSYRGPSGETGTVRVRTRLESTNGDALREAAIAGLGVLCEPCFIVHGGIESGALEPVLIEYQWYEMGIYAVYPAQRHLPTRVRVLIDYLAGRFGDTPYWETCLHRSPACKAGRHKHQ